MPTKNPYRRGQRVKTIVSDGERDRWWMYGTVIEVDGPWVVIDSDGTTLVYPAHELLPTY